METQKKYLVSFYHRKFDQTSFEVRGCNTQKEAKNLKSELKKEGKFDVNFERNINF